MALLRRKLIGKLGGMPDRDNPHGPALDTVEKAVRRYDDLSIRKVGKLGDRASGLWKLQKPTQDFLSPLPESSRSERSILANVLQRGKKLPYTDGADSPFLRIQGCPR